MMELFLEPVDVWLFRDGKPFDAMNDHRAGGMFPPYPTVVQGAIRSYHLTMKGVDLHDPKAIEQAIGTTECFGSLRLRGPFVAKRDGNRIVRYFPVPADATLAPDGTCHPTLLRRRQEMFGVLTSMPEELPVLLYPPKKMEPHKEREGMWMREDELLKYLRREPGQAIESKALFDCESRLGIGMNSDTRTTREGALYLVEFIRLHTNVGLWVQVEGYEGWPDTGILRLGGESRGARFEKLSKPLGWPQPSDSLPERFKVYFASPTYFEGGWRPKDWGRFFEGKVTLQAVALKRYESVGGFDLAAGDHKPACRYVPAGSVYYFKTEGAARLKSDLMNKAITDRWPEIGFGQVIISEWEED